MACERTSQQYRKIMLMLQAMDVRKDNQRTHKKKRRPKAPFQICILRRDDAGETTLNPGFKWGRCEAIGLPAARRTCTPGFVAPPWS
ncbi:hypothetical protein LMG919_11910 [Xanthomonas vesicatoria]|nr:hypothetical protein LMG919_11910 [Xanthomonas vesicatoria]